jgi:hypothetical protein
MLSAFLSLLKYLPQMSGGHHVPSFIRFNHGISNPCAGYWMLIIRREPDFTILT